MTLEKIRAGFNAFIVSGLLVSVSFFPDTAFAQQQAVQSQASIENLTKQKLSMMPNNSLLKLKKQLKILSKKQSLSASYRGAAKAKIPVVNTEIKRRGIGGRQGGQKAASYDILAVLHNYQNASQLTKKELKRRLAKLERLIDARGVKKKWKRRARAYRTADNAELHRRNGATNVTKNATDLTKANRKLLALLKDRRPLSQLNKSQLQRRVLQLQAIIANPDAAPRHVNKASRLIKQARGELNRWRNAGLNTTPIGTSIFAVLADKRPARSLSDAQLLQRLSRLERLIDARGIPKKFKRRARAIRALNQAERDRRRGSGVRQHGNGIGNGTGTGNTDIIAVLNDQRLAQNLSDSQLLTRLARLERLIDARGVSPGWKARARQMRESDLQERRARTSQLNLPTQNPAQLTLLSVLRDQRPSHRLSETQLRHRLANLRLVVDGYGISQNNKAQARSMYRRDAAELNRRRSAVGQNDDQRFDQSRILQLLADRRLARNLSDRQLRTRVDNVRGQMRRRNIAPDLRQRLSRKLAGDRAELRRRIAAQNNPYDQGQHVTSNRSKLGAVAQKLIKDFRTAQRLNRRQLRRRIRDAREVLLYAPLPRHQITQIKRIIKADRAEKRSRLLAARERRRIKLQKLRRQGQLRFKVAPQMRLPQSRDITGAEANDRMIQRQFLAGDGRSYARKYTRKEVISRPELTRRFGGVDIDTIKFGFNEYWVREEEVDEIERMAVTIERILAARPYEVFQIEGHTDAVGSDHYNLGLSRQRAKAVKDALTKYFLIPSSALITVGLGEQYLKIPTQQAEAENRRVTVRRITPLLRR